MQNCLDITILENGTLAIKATTEGIEFLQDQIECGNMSDPESEFITWRNTPASVWVDLLESYSCNGSYHLVNAGTFALTDDKMPIIADIPMGMLESDSDTEIYYPETKFWYYPEYAINDELEKLLNGETVIFQPLVTDQEPQLPIPEPEVLWVLISEEHTNIAIITEYDNAAMIKLAACEFYSMDSVDTCTLEKADSITPIMWHDPTDTYYKFTGMQDNEPCIYPICLSCLTVYR